MTAAVCTTSVMAFDAAPAAAQTRALPDLKQAYPSESYAQYHYGRRGYYGGRRGYYRGRGYGGAAAAGIRRTRGRRPYRRGDRLATGRTAPPPPYAVAPAAGGGDWLAYCSQRYQSFDPASGTFLGYDGRRHPCQ